MTMTITDIASVARYTATAAQTLFTVPFEFSAVTDLKVYKNGTLCTYAGSPSSSITYSVSGAGSTGGGTITFGAGLALEDLVVIERDVPVSRGSNFPTSGTFDITSLNSQLNKLTMIDQDHETRLNQQVLRVAVDDEAADLDPIPADRAGYVLGFDDDGNPSLFSSQTSLVAMASASQDGLMSSEDKTWLDAFKVRDITELGVAGSGDDTAAMNAIIAQINAGTLKGIITIPEGMWITVSGALTAITAGGWEFRHLGTRDQGGFVLDYSVGGGDRTKGNIFQIGTAGVSRVSYWGFRDLTIYTNNYRTDDGTRYLIEVPYANNCLLDNVEILYGHCIKWGSGTSTGGKAHIRNLVLQGNKALAGACFNIVNGSGLTLIDGNMTATSRNVISSGTFGSNAATDWTKGGDPAAITLNGSTCVVLGTGTGFYIEQTVDLVAGASYEFSVDITARTAGTLVCKLVGDTTVDGIGFAGTGTFTETIVAPANPTKVRLAWTATAGMTIDNVTVKRITSASFVGCRVGAEIAGGNIDSLSFYGFELNFPQDNDVPIVLEGDASYADNGSVFWDRCFFEYGVTTCRLHSANGSTGFLKNWHFNRCRFTPINTGIGNCIKVENTNNVPMNVLVNGGTLNGARADLVVTSAGSVVTASQMSLKFSNINIIDRAAGGGSAHPVFTVGTSGVEIDDCMTKVNWNGSNVAYASMLNRFFVASAAIADVKIVGNTFDVCTNTSEHIDMTAVTAFRSNFNHVIQGNRGITDNSWPKLDLDNSYSQNQGPGFATDTLVTGTVITIPDGKLKVGTRLRVMIDLTKTAAGTAAPVLTLRRGTTGTAADGSILSLTFAAQTAAADDGCILADFVISDVGAAGRIRGTGRLTHKLAATGLSTDSTSEATGTNASFDTTTTGQKFSLSLNAGASAAWTVRSVTAELKNLKG